MTGANDPAYLLTRQYNTAENLNARIDLHRRFSVNHYGWQPFVFDQLLAKLLDQARILEVGCGPAGLWLSNLERLPETWRITLSDFSPGMLDTARSQLTSRANQFDFAIADAQSLSFESASFDGVVANHMLYHVPNCDQAVGEFRRILKPNGALFAATNSELHMAEMGDLLRRSNAPADLWKDAVPMLTFSLENGQAQLAPHFSDIDLHLYDDALEVTDPDPLVAYVLSTYGRDQMTADLIAHLRQIIDDEIAAHGSAHITKSTGLFIAS